MTNKTAIKHLYKAIEILNTYGWCRGSNKKLIYGKPHYCAFGALQKATKNGDRASHIESLVNDNLEATLVSFNDELANDKRDVIRVFKKTIGVLEKA